MIPVSEAKQLIAGNVSHLTPQTVNLHEAAGYTLAGNIYAPGHFPPFRQSAMDGYAFAFADLDKQPLPVAGVVPAGAAADTLPLTGQAVRIFTGAPVPGGLDTVVMQEKTSVENGMLTVLDAGLVCGANIRKVGSEIEENTLALPAGTLLSPGAIGFIAGMGIDSVAVYPPPSVAILVTGRELQRLAQPLQFGQVYESNSYALTAALHRVGVAHVSVQMVDDDIDILTAAIDNSLQHADMLLLTGGVSVGDYDFVTKALQNVGAHTVFHKVRQRPGKPLLFAKKQQKVIFGLPGNPSSVLTCFYEFVLPALERLLNRPQPFLRTGVLPLAAGIGKQTQLTHFLKAWHQQGQVMPLDAQESFRMKSFAMANCLVVLPEAATQLQEGDEVEVHFLE